MLSEEELELESVLEQDSLAPDANFGDHAPWCMFRNFRERAAFKAMPETLRPAAERFMEDGFVVVENAISADLCDELVAAFQAFTARNADYFDKFRDEHGRLQRVLNLHLPLRALLTPFTRSERCLHFQDAVFSSSASLHTSLYYERGSEQDIHRDTPFFCTRPEFFYLGLWFALEDADESNGCLEVIRGGHLAPEVDRAAFTVDLYGGPENVPPAPMNLLDKYQTSVRDACAARGLARESVPMKKGSAMIWHPQLPHGGGPILEPGRTRHSVLMHTVPVGIAVYQADAFFNPRRPLPEDAEWGFRMFEGRAYAMHEHVDVMHLEPKAAGSFA